MGWFKDNILGAVPAYQQSDLPSEGDGSTMTLERTLTENDLVDIVEGRDGPVVIVAERDRGLTGTALSEWEALNPQARALRESRTTAEMTIPSLSEIGSSSPSPFTTFARMEYNRSLQGLIGLQKYDQMRRSDGTVRGTLRKVKTPVLAGRYYVEPYLKMGNDTPTTIDQNVSSFVQCSLFDWMSTPWMQTLTEALLMCDFGYYMFEKVWEPRIVDGQERIVLKKLAPRHPMDVKEWYFDANGGPAAVAFFNNVNDVLGEDIIIPIDKLLVFTFDKEAGNIEGISVLRSAYKHWYYKDMLYKIDAIQKERHGIGVPVIKLPPGFSDSDKLAAENLGRNLRTNERAHIVLPPNWEVLFAELSGSPVDCLKSIEHHNQEIEKNIVHDSSNADDDKQTMFLKATRFIAQIVVDAINEYLIPQIVDYNFARAGYPKLCVRQIGEQADQRTWSFSIRNLVGANIIQPDDKLESYAREIMDLPAKDPTTTRIGTVSERVSVQGELAPKPGDASAADAAPQPGTTPQPTRQTPPGTTPPNNKNKGNDTSGG